MSFNSKLGHNVSIAIAIGVGIALIAAFVALARITTNVWLKLLFMTMAFFTPLVVFSVSAKLRLFTDSYGGIATLFAFMHIPAVFYLLARARRAYLDAPEKYAFPLPMITGIDWAIYLFFIGLAVYAIAN